MKALLDQNVTLQIKALKGLIRASGVLGLDPSRYKNALRTIQPDTAGEKYGSDKYAGKKKKHTENTTASIQKPAIASYGYRKNRLLDAKVKNGRIHLLFSRQISRKSVKHFILERRGKILYVFDFKNVRSRFSIKRIKGGDFKEIRIAQFNPKKVRVVIETHRPYRPIVQTDGKSLSITLPAAGKRVKKSSYSKKVSLVKSLPVSGSKKNRKGRFTVVIDPGHGGKDAGAVGYKKRKEKDVTLSVAKRLKKVLEKRRFRVYLTRSSDRFIPLKKRTHFANRKQADFFLSIHANAAPKRGKRFKNKGLETFFLSPARSGRAKRVAALENRADIGDLDKYTKDTYLNVINREKIIESNKLAIDLQKQILSSLKRKYKGVVDNGVREGPFWVLVGAQMPAVLIEIGYITHPVEGKRLFNPNYQKLLAEGIANGLESYIRHNNL